MTTSGSVFGLLRINQAGRNEAVA